MKWPGFMNRKTVFIKFRKMANVHKSVLAKEIEVFIGCFIDYFVMNLAENGE